MLKKNKLLICFIFYSCVVIQCRSGLVTMTNACYTAIQNGQANNKSGNFSAALDQFNKVLDQCKAYDAKEKGYAGKAEAFNGLKQYNDALDAANAGLQINKSSIDNLFQRAAAELNLNRPADAKADFNTIIDLTQRNKNVTDRATIYAKMAEIDLRQNMYSDAMNNINTAISLDANNASFYILLGDLYSAQNNFQQASASYDNAINHGANATTAWTAKTEAQIKFYQQKYSTTNAGELASKMSSAEKQNLCSTINQAKNNGTKSMNIDLIQVSVCK